MHEVGLMREAVAIALDRAAAEGAARVHAIGLRVGALSGAVPEALALAFEVVTAGTPAARARLAIEASPIVCRCAACARDFTPAGMVFACPGCGAPSDDVRGGRELEVAYVEVS
jgi:hydrogenase nickel incorporation protein HypA/HybF